MFTTFKNFINKGAIRLTVPIILLGIFLFSFFSILIFRLSPQMLGGSYMDSVHLRNTMSIQIGNANAILADEGSIISNEEYGDGAFENLTPEEIINANPHLRHSLSSLNTSGLHFYIRSGDFYVYNIDTNTDFKEFPAYFIGYAESLSETNIPNLQIWSIWTNPNNPAPLNEQYIKVGMDRDTFNYFESQWETANLVSNIFYFLCYTSAIGILYCLYKEYKFQKKHRGATDESKTIFLGFNHVYVDVSLFLQASLFFTTAFAFSIFNSRFARSTINEFLPRFTPYLLANFLIISMFSSFLLVLLMAGVVNNFVNKKLFTHTLAFKILTLPLAIFYPAALNYAKIPTKELENLQSYINQIKGGNLNSSINIEPTSKLYPIAQDLKEISSGFQIAVNNSLKSEKLKIELISNVSHDIRTPLTSIVTYINLLKNENNTEEENIKYLDIVTQKADKLNTLIDDLFEASKASSGNIPINMEVLDINQVVKQALGELDEQIKESGLTFIVAVPETKLYAMADGKLLWRVLSNLFSNIFKYSMASSRVYVDVVSKKDTVCIVLKNISSHELNISPDELTERFVRGDESRNSEGSGLGLSIAHSFVNLMEGEFSIEIDGDLFKVSVILKSHNHIV